MLTTVQGLSNLISNVFTWDQWYVGEVMTDCARAKSEEAIKLYSVK